MSQNSPAPADPRRGPRWLCSHLVRLAVRDSTDDMVPGILEDINERGAGVSTDEFIPRGTRVEMLANGFRARAVVADCTQRESDWRASLTFDPGHGWHPTLWEPDHLYLVPSQGKGRKLRARAADGPSN